MNKGVALSARELVEQNASRYIGWLTEACAFPSMAGDGDGLSSMAQWVESKLAALGATTRRLQVEGAPDAILGELGSGPPAVLIYDHYDVQPVDPLDLWESKPFEADIRDGKFYARGAADNKGDLVARLAALDVFQELHGSPPIRIKFLIEGEEEVGSRHFGEITEKFGGDLGADGCIWEGDGLDHEGRPSFVFGAKGLAYVELTHRGLADDQHSMTAAYAPSPVWHLVEALATLRSSDGRVLIEGFYDDVVEPDADDIAMLERLPFEEGSERLRLGIDRFIAGATGAELLKRMFFAPTCNIAGIVAGFTVPGSSKTVLPKEAMAKLDLRLVPNQDPDDIVAKLRRHLDGNGFPDIEMDTHSMEHPVRCSSDTPLARAAIEAAQVVFEVEPALAPMMIGTGPMHHVAHGLGVPVVSPPGVARPESNLHAPNENVRVDDFLRIVEYSVAYLERYSATSSS